jgi:DNA-binding XRE family transcriptional regulator
MDEHSDAFQREFGRRVERRRRILHLTQQEVAQALRMNRSHYALLEKGRHARMRLDQVAMLPDILQTTLDYLLLRTEDDPGVIPPSPCPGAALSCGGMTLPPVTIIPEGVTANAEYSKVCRTTPL